MFHNTNFQDCIISNKNNFLKMPKLKIKFLRYNLIFIIKNETKLINLCHFFFHIKFNNVYDLCPLISL